MKGSICYLIAALLSLGLSISCANARLTRAYQRSQPRTETFIGEVTRNPEIDYDNKFQEFPHILYDESRRTNYYLDDNGKAQNLDQRRVEIQGTLEQKDTTIRVDSVKLLN
jgi:hypothetical protein